MSASPAGAVENLVAPCIGSLRNKAGRCARYPNRQRRPDNRRQSRQAWEFNVHWLEGGGEERKVSCVMLRKAEAGQLESDLVAEFGTISALWGSGVPVARALWMDSEGRWLERSSFIMEKVSGATDFFALLKPEAAERSRAIAERLAAIAARLHTRLEEAGRRFSPRHDTRDGGSGADLILGIALLEESDGAASGDARGVHLAKEHQPMPAESASSTAISASGIFFTKRSASMRCWIGRWCILEIRSRTSRVGVSLVVGPAGVSFPG